MDGWGAFTMLQNRQKGNQLRKKKLKAERDQKLIHSNIYTESEFDFPKASEATIRKIAEKTKKENQQELFIKYATIIVIIIALLIYAYFLGLF